MVDSIPSNIPVKSDTLPEKAISHENDASRELQDAIATRSKTLGKLVRRILPKHDPRACARLRKVIEMTADGIPWREISRKTKTGWIEITCINRNLAWRNLWHAARETGEDLRKELRLSEAHHRAVDGWNEPVYYKGKRCGIIRRFDSRLLEMLLKADDPAKFSEKAEVKHTGTGAEAGGITVVFQGVVFGQQPPPKTYDLTEKADLPPCQDKDPTRNNALYANVEARSATKTQPKAQKAQKHSKT